MTMKDKLNKVKWNEKLLTILKNLGLVVGVLAYCIPAIGFIVYAINNGGWLLILVSIVLSPIMILITLKIGEVIENFFLPEKHFSSPGYIMNSIPLNKSFVSNVYKVPPNCIEGSLMYTTDGVTIENRDDDILLHIMFALYNSSPNDITIYDINAHVYIDHIEDAALTLPENRTTIQLSVDNSILSQGKVYPLCPDKSLSIDLALRVSKIQEGIYENTICVFGILISFRQLLVDHVEHYSVPSDAIYIFRNPSTYYMNNRNFVKITVDDLSNISSMSTKRILSALLKRHLSQTNKVASNSQSRI